jgi:hypothetical protein
MIVDVTWDGVTLAKGATARVEAGGWFVELEQPMPVGTTLTLAGEAAGTVKVTRVHEGLGAGVVVKAVGSVVTSAAASEPVTAPNVPPHSATAPVEPAAAAPATDAPVEPAASAPPAPAEPDTASGPTAESADEPAPGPGGEAKADASKGPPGEGFGESVQTEEITNSGSNGKPSRKRKNSKPRIK